MSENATADQLAEQNRIQKEKWAALRIEQAQGETVRIRKWAVMQAMTITAPGGPTAATVIAAAREIEAYILEDPTK